jgi:DNA primase
MIVRGIELDINYLEEIENISFNHSRIRDNKLQACSPFRHETRPSFAINLENGLWVDSGAEQDHLRKGNIISFLAYIRGVSFEEIEDYLLEKYSVDFSDASKLELKINLASSFSKAEYNLDLQAEYSYSNYLYSRGISTEVQKLFGTFQTTLDNKEVVGMGWYNRNGKLINIKYRNTEDKKFFYAEKGEPIKKHIFGLSQVMNEQAQEIWIVESEIDALYLWSCGLYAVALGRASVNESQLKLLRKTGASSIVIATDNDTVGRAIHDTLIQELSPYFSLKSFVFPEGVKDVNDVEKNILIEGKYLLDNIHLPFII